MKVNKIALICLFLYAVVTLIRLFNHTPFFDEAHVWTIVEQLSFIDMFNYMKNEGHFFVWPALLYPFVKSHIVPYPYPMQIMNWLFCFLAMILLWWKAPFNNWIKALITFSFPFLGCYSIVARCYSIGILLIFALAAMFYNKNKYPKTYALLLILCANTGGMALIGASAFGVLFLVDIFKNKLSKKDYFFTGIILFTGAILILYQICKIGYFPELADSNHSYNTLMMLKNTYVSNNLLLNLLLSLGFAIPIIICFLKDKISLFFFLFSYFLFFCLAFRFYGVSFWHTYFLYIYLIIAFWLYKFEKSKIEKLALSVLAIISFILVVHYPLGEVYDAVYHSKAKEFISFIKNDNVLNNALIIHNSGEFYEVLPYSINEKFKIKNYCHKEGNVDYDLYDVWYSECVRGNIFGQAQKYPKIMKALAGDKTYAYTRNDKNPQINNYGIIMADGYSIIIEKYKCLKEHCFWKVSVK